MEPRASDQSALVASQRMRVAYLLTMVGGFLDAYTYVERGGVFANAQTGNIVKLGISLANDAHDQYLFYFIPICAFAMGLISAKLIEEILNRRRLRLVRRCVLAAEIVSLGIAGIMPTGTQWNALANSVVSFVAAMQYETFKTFRGEAIVTIMSTGNLRKCVDNLFDGIAYRDVHKLRLAAIFLSIIVTFGAGAFLGTRACDAMGRAAIIPAMVGLLLVIVIITVLRRHNAR